MTAEELIVLVGAEHAADGRLHAQHREVVAGDDLGLHALGLLADADGSRHEPPAQGVRERLSALLKILEDRIRVHPRPGVAAHVIRVLVDHHELVGRGHVEPPKQELIQERENRRVRADAERERQDGDGGKEGRSTQAAERQTEVEIAASCPD